MADFDVTLGSNKGNLNVEFDKPTQDLTLKNQAATKKQISETSTMLIAIPFKAIRRRMVSLYLSTMPIQNSFNYAQVI